MRYLVLQNPFTSLKFGLATATQDGQNVWHGKWQGKQGNSVPGWTCARRRPQQQRARQRAEPVTRVGGRGCETALRIAAGPNCSECTP